MMHSERTCRQNNSDHDATVGGNSRAESVGSLDPSASLGMTEWATVERSPKAGGRIMGTTSDSVRRRFGWAALVCAALGAGLMGSAVPLLGAEARIVRTAGAAGFLEGTANGVSIDRLGVVRLAERFEPLVEIAEPFLLSADQHPQGWVVGTGNDGKVLLIREDQEIVTLLDSPEQEVFAVLALDDGTVYAGTSPEGKVYRIVPAAGDAPAEVFEVFAPGEQYIWALGRDASGRLLVATGTEGRLFRVTETASPAAEGGASSQVETLYDAKDPHIRSLLVQGDTVVIGTAGEGRILRIDETGRPTSLYDAEQPEITAFSVGRDGAFYAAAVASEASLVDLSAAGGGGNGGAAQQNEGAQGGEQEKVEVSTGAASAGSRPAGYQGPRSEVFELKPNGSVESVARLRRETIYSMAYLQGRLVLATGQQGKLYSLRDGGELMLEQDLDSRQLVRVLASRDGRRLVLAATDAAALYASGQSKGRSVGTYRSKVHDARFVSQVGTLHWEGDPAEGAVEFAVRSGLSASPDETWSDWVEPGDGGGNSLALSEVPAGRYLQWRAKLSADAEASSPRIDAVEISYLQQNQRPQIEELTVLPPGEVFVAAGFNPANQAFEALTPNRDGVFVRIGDPASERKKKLWKLGYRTLTWKANDPNADELEYSLHVRAEHGRADGEATDSADRWFVVEEEFDEPQLGFDSTVLPDGRYRFRLTATDRPAQGAEALSAEEITGPVIVDHTPPSVRIAERSADSAVLEVRDALLPVRRVEYSVDAGPWRRAEALDGLIDSRTERVRVPWTSSQWVLVRVVDGAHNQQTHDLTSIGKGGAPQ